MTDEPQGLDQVQQRLQEIQIRKRAGIRWHISKRTAEIAIGALGPAASQPPRTPPQAGKQRRRKRKKRLL